MLTLWRKHKLLTSLFALATLLTLFFGFRTVREAIYWADPAHHNQAVQEWMTVGYIARSWKLDPRRLDALAGLQPPKQGGGPKPLKRIAKERGVPVADVIAEVEAAIATLKLVDPAP